MRDRSVSITIAATGNMQRNRVSLAGDVSKDMLYEPKSSKKMIRVLTVIGYMFTVSFAAIMLSVYYIFLWEPKDSDRTSRLAKGITTNCPPSQDPLQAPSIIAG